MLFKNIFKDFITFTFNISILKFSFRNQMVLVENNKKIDLLGEWLCHRVCIFFQDFLLPYKIFIEFTTDRCKNITFPQFRLRAILFGGGDCVVGGACRRDGH